MGLARLLLRCPAGFEADHINGDTLDNRRENLRTVTKAQNNMNRKCAFGVSRFKGVSHLPGGKKPWRAMIGTGGRNLHIGYFDSERGAAEAYDREARLLFGEFAATNYSHDGELQVEYTGERSA